MSGMSGEDEEQPANRSAGYSLVQVQDIESTE